jgi:hypothetical protein
MLKVLPYLFLTIGLLFACDYDSGLCVQSGLLLMLIGCVILIRRLEHRQDQPSDEIMRHT